MAFDPRKLAVSLAALLLLQLGWSLLDLAFPGSIGVTPVVLPQASPAAGPLRGAGWMREDALRLSYRLSEPARDLASPVSTILDPRGDRLGKLHALAAILWLVVVWGLGGASVARLAVVQEVENRQPAMAEALRFAWASRGSIILTPVIPLAAIVVCALTGSIFGLVYRIPGGAAVAGTLLVVPLVAGLVITLLAASVVAGWPFFHASLATGAQGSLDAFSRTYNYISQRIAHWLVACTFAWGLGIVGLFLADLLVDGVIRVTQWSLSLAGPPGEVFGLFWRPDLNRGTVAGSTHRFWLGGVRLLGHAWIYSYYWTAAAMIYLWLRADVDGSDLAAVQRAEPGEPTPSNGVNP